MAKTKAAPTAASLGDQLRAAIADRGLSGAEVARMAGVDPRIVGRFLAGRRDLYLATADRIARALGLRLR